MKKGIIGAGGFGREVYWSLDLYERIGCRFFVDDEYYSNNDDNIFPISKFDPQEYEIVIAVGNPKARKSIVESLPSETKYFTHIHPSAQIHGNDVQIGEGSIICAGTILTTNIVLGKHTHLNLQTTIGHDCRIGDYFTTAPGSKISGNCKIGTCVYFGTNSSVREKITIWDDVTVGLNSGVVKDITESGIYGGLPAKLLRK